jgi:peptide deformylase
MSASPRPAPYRIRTYGDPVLKRAAEEVTDIDGHLAKVVEDMLVTMYEAPGMGLAAPQVGISQRFFVYDHGDGPAVIFNPVIKESRGEWAFDEGCLSVPELSWEIIRPKEVHLVGFDLNGNEVSIEADEVVARLFQHELDHLDGRLLLEYLDEDQRRAARRILRERAMDEAALEPEPPISGPGRRGLLGFGRR